MRLRQRNATERGKKRFETSTIDININYEMILWEVHSIRNCENKVNYERISFAKEIAKKVRESVC